MSLSQREVTQLRQLLSKMSVKPAPAAAPKKKKNRRRNKKSGAAASQGIPAGMTRGTNASGTRANSGEVTISRTELLGAISYPSAGDGSGNIPLYPTSEHLAWLQKVCAAFERIEWLSAVVHWKPFVGTNTAGSVAFGVDWNSVIGTVSRAKVQSCTPVYESPIWQAGQLVLPQKYLMTRRFYLLESKQDADKQPGIVLWALAGAAKPSVGSTEYGELWVTYKVRLSGTTS